MNGVENLQAMFAKADEIDRREGLVAYQRYNKLLTDIADKYYFPLERVVHAFVSLSPNSDYTSNLRSLVSVLDGINHNIPEDRIVVATYGHCRRRAYNYVLGRLNFNEHNSGLKILNFCHNIINPFDHNYVTIDGHMVAAYRGENLTMKEAILKSKCDYREIAFTVKMLAFSEFMLPNQYQSIVWFTRKRVFNIKYDAQYSCFGAPDDFWNTYRDVNSIKPYPILPIA